LNSTNIGFRAFGKAIGTFYYGKDEIINRSILDDGTSTVEAQYNNYNVIPRPEKYCTIVGAGVTSSGLRQSQHRGCSYRGLYSTQADLVLHRQGVETVLQNILGKETASAIFWGFDLDAVRAADAPRVSGPTPFGLDFLSSTLTCN
jgi:arginase family enzyme